jgi:SAM-dependent methyltransferase
MTLLNLGCGTKVSAHPDVINIDWSIYLRLKRNPIMRRLTPLMISGERLRKFRSLPGNIRVHDLARGLPFPADSVDAVYHSHVLEHLDRDVARSFLVEVRRVLKPGGVHRLVVPDLEEACRVYLAHISIAEGDPREAITHDRYVAAIIEQCVRRESAGTAQQLPVRRMLENLVRGDARRQGDAHRWMYDRINLGALLQDTGYQQIRVRSFDTSRIADWASYELDQNGYGQEYKPESLYLEAIK